MYKTIDTLNTFDFETKFRCQERWSTDEGNDSLNLVIEKILENDLNHLLNYLFSLHWFEDNLDDEFDLKGIRIFHKDFILKTPNDLKAIDFSYSDFSNITFENFAFINVKFNFCTLFKCKFVNCDFLSTKFYGSKIENSTFDNCRFLERNKINNTLLENTVFTKIYVSNDLFVDCNFNTNTFIDKIMLTIDNSKHRFNESLHSQYYLSISEAYESGKVFEKRSEYLYLTKASYTRYNTFGLRQYYSYIIEFLTGYGLKPLRPMLLSIITIILFSFIFYFDKNDYLNSLQVSLSAFLTVGDTNSLSSIFKWLFLFESFIGVFSIGLFLGTLLNIWFSEK